MDASKDPEGSNFITPATIFCRYSLHVPSSRGSMPTWISSCNGLVSEDVLITARITLKLCSYKFQWDATICDDILDVTPVIQTFTIINNYNYYAISEKLFSTLSLSASSHECSRVSSRERSNNTIVSVLIDKIYWISVADILVSDFIE